MDIEEIRKNHRPAKQLSGGQQALGAALKGAFLCLLAVGVAYQLYRGWVWLFPPTDPAIESAQGEARDRTFAAQEGVRYHAKDPASVQFREVFATATMVCGQYNARNSYGAYAGFMRFVSDGKNVIWIEDDIGKDRIDLIWREHCQR
jgi:hypothetical protein